MLQGGINKGEAQSLSVQAECTTPPRRGGQTVLTLLVKDKLGGNGLDISYFETQKDRDYSKDTGLLQAARASCKVWRVW